MAAMSLPLQRVPVVGGLAYVERVRHLPSTFTATLSPELTNKYFPFAIAVLASGEKVGYVAPEVARSYYQALTVRDDGALITCPARRAAPSDHETSGIELMLDFSALNLEPAS